MANTGVFNLAKAEIKKKDDDKAIEALKERVEDNKMQWDNEIHGAKKALRSAESNLASARRTTGVTAADFIEIERGVALAKSNLETMEAAYEARFSA